MSLRTPNLSVEIAVSNMDLYPCDVPRHPSWVSDLEQLVPHLQATGCRNYEVHLTKAIMRDVEARERRGDIEPINLLIGSMHQTFNQGNDPFGKVADWRGVLRSLASIDGMLAVQRVLSRPVPSVHYSERPPATRPPIPPVALQPTYFGSFPIIQPSPEVYRDFGVRNNEDLLGKLALHGLVGLCPDTVHARSKDGGDATRRPVAEVWTGQFASGRVFEMHVSADRRDLKGRDPELAAQSHQEFLAFISRRWQNARDTVLGEMITGAIENWVPPVELTQALGRPILRQVIEIPPLPRPGAFLRRVAQHARFVENLAEVVREAGGTPLLWGDAA